MSEKQYAVSAVIVTYNRLELLKESLAAVLNQTGGYLKHVIVVNNNSTDGTADYLATLDDDRIIVKNLTENVGGSGGFNEGVREFGEKTTDDAVWLMDDDTLPEPDALKVLVEYVQRHPKVGFVNSNVRWQSKDGVPSWMNVVAPRGFFWPLAMTNGENAVEVVNSTFVSVMIPRFVVEQIGLPQKEYFIWGDDIEYTNRAADVYRGYFLPDSVVVHKSKENTTPGDVVQEEDASRLWRYDYEFRNRLLTTRRIFGRKAMLKQSLRTLRYEFLALFRPTVKFRWRKVRSIVKGTWQGLFFNPSIEYLHGEKPTFVRSINAIEAKRHEMVAAGDESVKHLENEEVEAIIVEKFGASAASKKKI